MNPDIPIVLSIAFLIAICIPIFMIANLARQYTSPSKSKKVFYGIIAFYVVYLAIVGIATLKGVFVEASLPPTIVKFTTIPLLLFLVGFVFNHRLFKRTLGAIPVSKLIRLHIFRLIGSTFIVLMLLGKLPPLFALIAGVGDVVTALTSLWVARLIKQESAKSIALFWNTFGLADILLTSTLAIILTKASMETGGLGVDTLATFPFCFIPAFAPPTIILLHLSIYRKLLDKKFQ